jgi:GT2 family glycosyltransferase
MMQKARPSWSESLILRRIRVAWSADRVTRINLFLELVLVCVLLSQALSVSHWYTSSATRSSSAAALSHSRVSKEVAFLVKTYERPTCLYRTLRSILLIVPDATIIVADDSGHDDVDSGASDLQRVSAMFPQMQLVRIALKFDVGVSAGRNALVGRAHKLGFRYVFMLDDDYLFTHDVDLARMLQLLESGVADIVAANRCEAMPFDDSTCRSHASLVRVGDTMFVVPGASKYLDQQGDCVRTEFVQNVFMGKVDFLRRVRWDPVLKNNDHYDFFYRANFEHRGNIWMCKDIHVLHGKRGCQPSGEVGRRYAEVRSQRWKALMVYVAEKLGFRTLVDEDGMIIRVERQAVAAAAAAAAAPAPAVATPTDAALVGGAFSSASSVSMSELAPCIPRRNWTRNDAMLHMESQVLSLMNSQLPGYYQLAATERMDYCVHPYQAHLFRIKGVLQSPYANWYAPSAEIDYVLFDADVFYPSEGLPSGLPIVPSHRYSMSYPPGIHLHHLSTLPLWSRSARPTVYFVSVVKDCYNYTARLLSNIKASARAGYPLHVVLVNVGSTDGDYDALAASVRGGDGVGLPLQVTVVHAEGAFSRTIGLHLGIEEVSLLTQGDPNAKIFVTDTSIVLPTDMPERITRFAQCGHSVYVPIATKILGIESDEEALGFSGVEDPKYPPRKRGFVMAGKGMAGFCASDYRKARGFDFAHGYRWGLEDEAIVNDFMAAGLRVIRPQEPGYFHAQYKSPSLATYRTSSNGAAPVSQLGIIPETVSVPPTDVWFHYIARYVDDRHLGTIEAAWYTYPSSTYGAYYIQVVDAKSQRELVVLQGNLGPRLRAMAKQPYQPRNWFRWGWNTTV